MKRGAKSTEEVIAELITCKEDIFMNFHHSSASIWTDISKKLQNKITPKGLYTFVKDNRANCWDVLGINCKIKNHDNKQSPSEASEDEVEHEACELAIPFESWQKMIRTDCRRLQSGWSDLINDVLFSSSCFNECIWAFKHGYVNKSYEVTIQGNCTECGCKINMTGVVPDGEKIAELPMYFRCDIIKPVNKMLHTGARKRKLTGARRKIFGDVLKNELPINVLRDTCLKTKSSDPLLRNIPNLDSLKKCKSETLTVKDGKNSVSKPVRQHEIEKLHILQFTEPYSSAIHHLAFCKFAIMFWSREQLCIYNAYLKESKNEPTKLAIDATGGVVKKLPRPYNGTSGNIFLYSAVIHINSQHGQVPVTQMLSEAHDTESISSWLIRWKRHGANLPKMTVTDHSLALLGAICWAFNEIYLSRYLEETFALLTIPIDKHHLAKIPNVYIRIDYAHCIKIVSGWASLKKKPRRFREFYMHAMAKLIQCNVLKDAEKIIESIIVLSNSEFIGFHNGEAIPAQQHKIYLQKLISSLEPVVLDDQSDSDFQSDVLNDSNEAESIKQWIQQLRRKALDQCNVDTGDDNFHYSPEVTDDLLKFLRTFTLWSAVLKPVFGYGGLKESSSIVESYFNDVKNRTFSSNELPMKVDKFFLRLYKAIQGMIIVAETEKNVVCNKDHLEIKKERTDQAEKNSGRTCSETTNPSTSIVKELDEMYDTELTEELWVENWRGLGRGQAKRRRTAYYGIPCPEILTLEAGKKVKIPLLKNGNCSNSPQGYEKQKYLLKNTCPFDTVIQMLSSAFCDSPEVKKYFLEGDCAAENDFFVFVKRFMSIGAKQEILKKRLEIIVKSGKFVVQDTTNNSIHIVKCECNITYLFTSFVEYLKCGEEVTTCGTCNYSKRRDLPFFAVNVTENFYANLKQYFLNFEEHMSSYCPKCKNLIQPAYSVSPYITIDSDKGICRLSDLPISIQFNERNYILRSISHFEEPIPINAAAIGHYVAFCRRIDGIWEIYDDCQKEFKPTKASQIVNPHLLFYSL